MYLEITIRTAGRPFDEEFAESDGTLAVRLTALGLVISEHVDKIAFFEPSVTVLSKEVGGDSVRFVLRRANAAGKSMDDIVRGFKIGCFKIAREYGLVDVQDAKPIFAPGFEMRELSVR